jgi:PAS domain S-box-containing protein
MGSDFDFDRFCPILVRETPDAVIYADSNGVIRFWNAGAARIFGFSGAETIGNSLDMIIPQNLRALHWAGYNEAVRTGNTRYPAGEILAVPALRRDGARISIELTLLPFRDERGTIVGIGAILRDVTKRLQELRNLRRQRIDDRPADD